MPVLEFVSENIKNEICNKENKEWYCKRVCSTTPILTSICWISVFNLPMAPFSLATGVASVIFPVFKSNCIWTHFCYQLFCSGYLLCLVVPWHHLIPLWLHSDPLVVCCFSQFGLWVCHLYLKMILSQTYTHGPEVIIVRSSGTMYLFVLLPSAQTGYWGIFLLCWLFPAWFLCLYWVSPNCSWYLTRFVQYSVFLILVRLQWTENWTYTSVVNHHLVVRSPIFLVRNISEFETWCHPLQL